MSIISAKSLIKTKSPQVAQAESIEQNDGLREWAKRVDRHLEYLSSQLQRSSLVTAATLQTVQEYLVSFRVSEKEFNERVEYHIAKLNDIASRRSREE